MCNFAHFVGQIALTTPNWCGHMPARIVRCRGMYPRWDSNPHAPHRTAAPKAAVYTIPPRGYRMGWGGPRGVTQGPPLPRPATGGGVVAAPCHIRDSAYFGGPHNNILWVVDKTVDISSGSEPNRQKEPAAKPVSLRPLKVEEALGDLLKVKARNEKDHAGDREKARQEEAKNG